MNAQTERKWPLAEATYRKARISDVEFIHGLINRQAENGLMLPRPLSLLYEAVWEFTIACVDGQPVGTGGLHIIWSDLAEIRALAVVPEYQKMGIGTGLVETLVKEAKSLGIKRVFALTYAPGFFAKCGFREISKEAMPHKVWKDCINCPKFPNCDEVAMVQDLDEGLK